MYSPASTRYDSPEFYRRCGRSGVKLPLMRNIDVAPTVAELLHLKMPGVEGEPLREILE